MTARYRHVWLVLDPFNGQRVTLGALVETPGRVAFVRAADQAWKDLTASQAVLARSVTVDLLEADSFDELPIGAGPQVVAEPPIAVPATVGTAEAERWVGRRVVERRVAA